MYHIVFIKTENIAVDEIKGETITRVNGNVSFFADKR